MSRTAARFTQADVARAGGGAIKGGIKVSGVRIDADGSIIVLSSPEAPLIQGPDDPAGWRERLNEARGWSK